MRLRLLLAGLGVTLGACSGASDVTIFTGPTAPPIPVPTVEVSGALPDGTPFAVSIEEDLSDVVEAISAGVVIEVNGSPQAVGIVTIGSPHRDKHFFHHGVDLPPFGGIHIDFYDHILEELGPDHEEVIAGSIRGTINRGFPGLDLDPPFRWAEDQELPLQMEVVYRDFVIRRGCSASALGCSVSKTVQILPAEGTEIDWAATLVIIDSPEPEAGP